MCRQSSYLAQKRRGAFTSLSLSTSDIKALAFCRVIQGVKKNEKGGAEMTTTVKNGFHLRREQKKTSEESTTKKKFCVPLKKSEIPTSAHKESFLYLVIGASVAARWLRDGRILFNGYGYSGAKTCLLRKKR